MPVAKKLHQSSNVNSTRPAPSKGQKAFAERRLIRWTDNRLIDVSGADSRYSQAAQVDSPRLIGSTGLCFRSCRCSAKASQIAGAAGLIAEKPFAPYAIAGAITLLLFAGIYGAWSVTLWIARNRDKT
jgi:hypothetical protein